MLSANPDRRFKSGSRNQIKDSETSVSESFFVSALRRNLNPWFYQGTIKSLGKIKPPCYGGDGLATASQESSREVLDNEK